MILPASFEYEITKTHDTGVTELRCNATSIDEINTWVDEFGKLNNTHWNFRSSVPNGTRIVCSKKFVCHHSAFQKPSRDDNKKGLSKNADCPATIKATVKIDTISTRKKDPFIKRGLVCSIEINDNHTHSTKSGESLRFLPADNNVRDIFNEYFDSGMGIAEAQKYHEQLIELKEDFMLESLANGSINPCYRTIRNWHDTWINLNLGPSVNYGHNIFMIITPYYSTTRALVRDKDAKNLAAKLSLQNSLILIYHGIGLFW